DPRWLWVPFKESELGVSRDLIACWMDILVSAGLERAEGGQNTWIIIDELDTLGELASLIAATTKLRKRNVRVVVAFQSY
ncbi:type IV secretion system DNA-binding domain-containing protein, partial [Pseudomonas lundensis]